jgi:hypothetical protein
VTLEYISINVRKAKMASSNPLFLTKSLQSLQKEADGHGEDQTLKI